MYLDAGARALLAEAAGQGPAAGWDMRDLGDGLHLLGAADADLGRTQGAASGLSSLAGLQGLRKERTVCWNQAVGRQGSGRGPSPILCPKWTTEQALVCALRWLGLNNDWESIHQCVRLTEYMSACDCVGLKTEMFPCAGEYVCKVPFSFAPQAFVNSIFRVIRTATHFACVSGWQL